MNIRDFFKKPPVKTIILTLLTICVSVSVAILGNWAPSQGHFILKIVFFLVCVIADLVTLCIYTRIEVNDHRTAEIQKRQAGTFEDLITSIISICETNATNINNCIHEVNRIQKIDLNIWSFNKACGAICDSIYNNICKLGNSKKYGVAFVRLIEEGDESEVEMVAYANQNRRKPTVFGKKRSFKNIDLHSAYHDLCLFYEAKSDIDIVMGVEEVAKVFVQNKGTIKKRHLYIGIPVICDNRKMIGLLEIVGMDESMLNCITREEVEEVVSKFLVPYAYMFLLIHKMEKALLAGTGSDNASATSATVSKDL